MRKVMLTICLVVFGCVSSNCFGIESEEIHFLSDDIFDEAQELQKRSHRSEVDLEELRRVTRELGLLLKEYELALLFAECEYEGEIKLGTTSAIGGNLVWIECDDFYKGLVEEIRLRKINTIGGRYLRIREVEVVSVSSQGLIKDVYPQEERVALYPGGVFKLSFPTPVKIAYVRVLANYGSAGLGLYGVPYMSMENQYKERSRRPWRFPRIFPGDSRRFPERNEEKRPVIVHPPVVVSSRTPAPEPGTIIEMGRTPEGNSTWLETLCSGAEEHPIRQILLIRTGQRANYLRINDIEVTYLPPLPLRGRGPQKPKTEVFNKGGRVKLYQEGAFNLALPKPMRVVRVRVNINHQSTGLIVQGVH